MRSLVALLALALLAPAAAAGGPAGPYPVPIPLTPQWIDGRQNGTVDPVCCAWFNATINATDPDDSGLYDTLDARFVANGTTTPRPLFPSLSPSLPPGPGIPERLDFFASANLTGEDSRRRDVFDHVRADASVTLRTASFGAVLVRVGAACWDAAPAPGPETCVADPPVVVAAPP